MQNPPRLPIQVRIDCVGCHGCPVSLFFFFFFCLLFFCLSFFLSIFPSFFLPPVCPSASLAVPYFDSSYPFSSPAERQDHATAISQNQKASFVPSKGIPPPRREPGSRSQATWTDRAGRQLDKNATAAADAAASWFGCRAVPCHAKPCSIRHGMWCAQHSLPLPLGGGYLIRLAAVPQRSWPDIWEELRLLSPHRTEQSLLRNVGRLQRLGEWTKDQQAVGSSSRIQLG
ncbi:hypothetical protein LX36DRAFT_421637 [Colletotrichum falcatum]|nr:hypothetical protein LX36DRAFT_421637 [Colletotrichum falcatum]